MSGKTMLRKSWANLLNYWRQRMEFVEEKNFVAGLQLLPSVSLITTLLGGSFIIVLAYSFSEGTLFNFSVENYLEFLTSPLYTGVLRTTVENAVAATSLTLLIAYPIAYYIAIIKADSNYRSLLLLMLVAPYWVAPVIRAFAWRLMLSRQGVLNYILADYLQIVSESFYLLHTRAAVLIGLVHVFIPYMVLPIYASLRGVETDQIKAAKNLGANKLESFIEITLPQTIPGIVAGTTFVFILNFGSFLVPSLLGGTEHAMIANSIARMFRGWDDWYLGSAMAVGFTTIVVTIIYLVNNIVSVNTIFGEEDVQ